MIRLIRDTPDVENTTPTVMGVDDWAIRKGQSYGTILVDLETHKPVDLLPERSADTLATWLKEHPGIEIISRDRSNEYSKGATEGAPDAIQIADRWHLKKNLRETDERYLEQNQGCLAAAGKTEDTSQTEEAVIQPAKLTKHEQERYIKRAKRVRRYEAVRQLHQQGLSQHEIARRMGIGPQAVRKYRKAQQKRGRLARQRSRKKLGSRTREKARLRLARLDEHIANQRCDFHHKLSRQLVEDNRFIGLEDLNVRGVLTCEGDWYGCQVEKVNRWHPSSKTCSACGAVIEAMPLHVHEWQCPACDLVHDRDVKRSRNGCRHSGINILNQSTVGVTGSHVWGQPVRPDIAAAIGQRWMNQEANLL